MTEELKAFILNQVQERKVSIRELARLAGVSHTAVSKQLWDDPPEPTLELLTKLARVTGVSVTALVAMVVPDDVVADAEALALAEQIKNLPPDKREMIEALVRGYGMKS
jgi:transcriptional regulator with XRE-family HTH domain